MGGLRSVVDCIFAHDRRELRRKNPWTIPECFPFGRYREPAIFPKKETLPRRDRLHRHRLHHGKSRFITIPIVIVIRERFPATQSEEQSIPITTGNTSTAAVIIASTRRENAKCL